MFQTPSKGSSQVALAEPLDINNRYVVRLEQIVDEGVSKFADTNKPNPEHSLRWVFQVFNTDKTPVLTVDDTTYEIWEWTSSKTGKGNGKTAKARLWIEALLGRPLEDNEITADTANDILGKVAVCLFEDKETGGQDGQELTTRTRILRLSPYKGEAAAPAAPKPAPKAKPAPAADLPWDAPKATAVTAAPAF